MASTLGCLPKDEGSIPSEIAYADYADMVQWLVCVLAKDEMRVRFSLFALKSG